ncbi:DUF11 domain-containing protein [Streptomyces sp. NBC_00237]|uniref:hypothetical protein n=1 Tax=Streptomyces sp. NBC_00237 TaxID=2975687 RepID=UPI0022565F9F|nr:hypothetical protein [Streptomyces sp. NBC_00237]MCX5203184.1 DUF11 domain-containing protein [Streptomyces sp. NBC_00237]
MSSTSPARRTSWRTRLTALFGGLVLAFAGLFAVAPAAHADANLQLSESGDPVPANTPYTYTINLPFIGDSFASQFDITADLSGAAATFTGWSIASDPTDSCTLTGTHVACTIFPDNLPVDDGVITLTVLPTAAGTVNVTSTATVPDFGGYQWGTDSITTTISAPPAADLAVDVTGQPHLGILVPYLTYSLKASNNGPAGATSATVTASLPPGASATNLSSGCTTSSGTVTCTYGAIANGANSTKSFRIPLHLLSLGHVTVTGTRTASAPTDNNAANDSDTVTCTVVSVVLATCP